MFLCLQSYKPLLAVLIGNENRQNTKRYQCGRALFKLTALIYIRYLLCTSKEVVGIHSNRRLHPCIYLINTIILRNAYAQVPYRCSKNDSVRYFQPPIAHMTLGSRLWCWKHRQLQKGEIELNSKRGQATSKPVSLTGGANSTCTINQNAAN